MSKVRRKILVVSDDAAAIAKLGQRLEKFGFEAIAASPKHTISVLLESNCRVALIDLDIPDSLGIDLLDEINRTDGGVKVIVLASATTSQSDLLRAMRRGAAGCVFKPIDPPDQCVQLLETAFSFFDRWRDILRKSSASDPNPRRRRCPREPLSDASVAIETAEGIETAHAVDLSTGGIGVCIEAPKDLFVGDRTNVLFNNDWKQAEVRSIADTDTSHLRLGLKWVEEESSDVSG